MWKNNLKERTADATWEMLVLKFIINYSEYTAVNRALGDRKHELGATFDVKERVLRLKQNYYFHYVLCSC